MKYVSSIHSYVRKNRKSDLPVLGNRAASARVRANRGVSVGQLRRTLLENLSMKVVYKVHRKELDHRLSIDTAAENWPKVCCIDTAFHPLILFCLLWCDFCLGLASQQETLIQLCHFYVHHATRSFKSSRILLSRPLNYEDVKQRLHSRG